MPSNRNPNDPNSPLEDEDLIGAADDDEAEDDDAEDEDDDIVDEEDDEDDEDEDDEEDEDEEDEDEAEGDIEASADRTGPTAEVGGEGGSPGDAVERVHSRAGLGRGSEATTTWEGGRDDSRDRYDDNGVLIKRAP